MGRWEASCSLSKRGQAATERVQCAGSRDSLYKGRGYIAAELMIRWRRLLYILRLLSSAPNKLIFVIKKEARLKTSFAATVRLDLDWTWRRTTKLEVSPSPLFQPEVWERLIVRSQKK